MCKSSRTCRLHQNVLVPEAIWGISNVLRQLIIIAELPNWSKSQNYLEIFVSWNAPSIKSISVHIVMEMSSDWEADNAQI